MSTYNSQHTGAQIDEAISIVRGNYPGINLIGTAGEQGFGVGICPPDSLPSYIKPLQGTFDVTSDEYGNYYCTTDGSIMVWIPRFYYKFESDNSVEVKGIDTYPLNDNAVADGFVVHRMFINGGSIVDGVFVDKYDWSLTNFEHGVSGIASSIKNANPISSDSDSNRDASNNYAGSFSDCISNSQTPSDTYGGAWAAAKSRGDDFAVWSIFIAKGLALLSLAHGQASSATTNCAWYDATDNFPKGHNSNGDDADDPSCTFTYADDGYWDGRNEAAKTGSGDAFAKTTHNGQNCGVADLNGNQWKIMQGLTAIVSSKTIVSMTSTDTGTKVQLEITAHGLSVGDWIQIDNGDTEIDNTIWKITDVVDADNVKIASSATDFGTTPGIIYYGSFYLFKESVDIKNVTGGNSIDATDHFDDTFIAANMDDIEMNFVNGGGFAQYYGNSTNQVLPFSTDRDSNDYKLGSAGLPKDGGASGSGTNLFGTDYFYQYLRDELGALSGGDWYRGTIAGVWGLSLLYIRTSSGRSTSARSCLYV